MSRIAVGLLTVSLVVSSAGTADAQKPHRAWWQFLKGKWSYEISPLNMKGTATWRMTAKRNTLVGRFAEEDGSVGIELSGWRSDTRTMTAHGYGSKGNYWQLELTTVTADKIEGTNRGILPDGRSYEGSFIGKRIDDDHYEWHLKGKTGDGEDFNATGKFTRMSE